MGRNKKRGGAAGGFSMGSREEWEMLDDAGLMRLMHAKGAQLLAAHGSPGPAAAGAEAACAAFTEWLLNERLRGGRRMEEFLAAAEDEFLGRMPLVLRIGMAAMEDSIAAAGEDGMMEELASMLDADQLADAEALAACISGIDADRTLTILCGGEGARQAFLRKGMPDVEAASAMADLRDIATGLMHYGGSIVLRYPDPAAPGREIVNGFLFRDGCACRIPPAVLREATEIQPDGSRVRFPEDEYREAFCHFRTAGRLEQAPGH